MFTSNLKNIITKAAPVNTGVSFNAIISICVAVIIMSVLVIKPLAGGR